MTPIALPEIVAKFEISSDDHHYYLNTKTGAIAEVSTQQFRVAGARPPGMPPHIFPITEPDADPAVARDVLESGDYVVLPAKLDSHEWILMENFIRSLTDKALEKTLEQALHGRGVERAFQEALHRLDLYDHWRRYQREALKDLARKWCDRHSIAYVDRPDPAEAVAAEHDYAAVIKTGLAPHTLTEAELRVLIAVIQATGDFTYQETLVWSDGAIERAQALVRAGGRIAADTPMLLAGLRAAGTSDAIACYRDHPDVLRQAQKQGISPEAAAIDRAIESGCDIIVIGYAPEALESLNTILPSQSGPPRLIVAVPAGFTGAGAAKARLRASGTPWISTIGPKGGVSVAVAILRTLLDADAGPA